MSRAATTTTSPAPSMASAVSLEGDRGEEHASAETHDDADDLGGDASHQSDAGTEQEGCAGKEAPEGGGPHDREATRAGLPGL